MLALSIVKPPGKLLAAYEVVTAPLLERVISNRRECKTLAATRDLLLPKLMSGELRVRDAKRVAETVL